MRAPLVPDVGGEIAMLVVNVVGAFLLGVLTGALSRRPQSDAGRRLSLLVGTGLLGGFTTYSAFALLATDPAWLLPAFATALIGFGAAWGGLVVASRRRTS